MECKQHYNSDKTKTLTDVPLGYEINQISPLDHLWFVLKVSEIVRDTAHQFKTWRPDVQESITGQIFKPHVTNAAYIK